MAWLRPLVMNAVSLRTGITLARVREHILHGTPAVICYRLTLRTHLW